MKKFYVSTPEGEFEIAEPDLKRDAVVQENMELADWIEKCKVADVWDDTMFQLQCVGEITIH